MPSSAEQAGPVSDDAHGGPRVPRATYRLQFNHTFRFDDARALVDYLDALGISDLYASPYLAARAGTLHGYDLVDHNALNPEIGSPADYDRLVAALHDRGMGQILDVVPNHMGVMGADNAWWMDVLENGEASSYACFFDIDWQPIDLVLAGKVLVPVLGSHYGVALERGDLRLVFERAGGTFSFTCFEHRFPVDPVSYRGILERALEQDLAPGARSEVTSVASAFGKLPPRSETAADKRATRNHDKETHKARLAALAAADPAIAAGIDAAVCELNGGSGAGRDALHALLEAQAYRLAYWRVASDQINYRRFFDINDLAALRMEDEAVFEATHRLVLELLAEGRVDGLRIDHPDGLYAPAEYFRRLQEGNAKPVARLEARDCAGQTGERIGDACVSALKRTRLVCVVGVEHIGYGA
jgi:(1->4)-alpha-D-glucan 1-alpha-D-glucosylmutase